MKKIISLFILLGLTLSQASAYQDAMPISIQEDEMRICTMEYMPVCGVDGITYGNKCSAGNNKIAYEGECNSYIDNSLYAKLESSKTTYLKEKLSKYDTDKLLKLADTAQKVIEATKLSRIAKQMQVEKITVLTFIKNTIYKIVDAK